MPFFKSHKRALIKTAIKIPQEYFSLFKKKIQKKNNSIGVFYRMQHLSGILKYSSIGSIHQNFLVHYIK